jgi:hypothetical protein
VFDRDGLPLEKKAEAYLDQVMEVFVQSPEGQQLWSEGMEPDWARMKLDFGMNYLSVTPPQMLPGDVSEILFELFPRKVSASADEAPAIVRELQAFWQFLQREFHLENAAACLTVLDEKAAHKLKREMGDLASAIRQEETVDDVDRDKVDEIVLVLMQLTLHDSYRAWKEFEWETLDRLTSPNIQFEELATNPLPRVMLA